MERINDVDGSAQSETAGRRVARVHRIDDQSAMHLSRALNLDLAIQRNHHSRNKRQSVGQRKRPQRALIRLLRLDRLAWRRSLLRNVFSGRLYAHGFLYPGNRHDLDVENGLRNGSSVDNLLYGCVPSLMDG